MACEINIRTSEHFNRNRQEMKNKKTYFLKALEQLEK